MKQLLYIFALYFLYLSVFPCGDDTGCSKPAETNFMVIDHNDTDQTEHTESCPPLCNCGCCGFQVLRFCSSIKIPALNFDSAYNPSTLHFQLQEIYFPVWQPPQLG